MPDGKVNSADDGDSRIDIVAVLKGERATLKPVVDALAQVPALEEALRAAAQEEVDWRERKDQPYYQSQPDHRAIELNGATDRARNELDRVKASGATAERRIRQIDALLNGVRNFESILAEQKQKRATLAAAQQRADKAASLSAEIENEIAQAEEERGSTIDRGVEERLEGRTDTSAKSLTKIDADLVIKRAALSGARRAHAAATAALESLPEELREIGGRLRGAAGFREELAWLQAKADFERAAAGWIAAQQVQGVYADKVEIRPPEALIREHVAMLEAEIRGVASA